MASLATKKHFSNVAALRRFTPAVLAEFLRCFPEYLERRGLDIPPPAEVMKLPYDDILGACMASDIDRELNRVLFMATQLGNSAGWTQIEEEMDVRGLKPRFNPAPFTFHDLPLLTWLRRKVPEEEDILEQSYARVRIHGKSVYRYYAPTRDERSKFSRPSAKLIEGLRRDLAHYFTNDRKHRGVKLFDYNYDEEIWFLLRYPGQPVRPDAIRKDGREGDLSYVPGEYDAIVYHKTYGDLRLNTVRGKDHATYRVAFGKLLLRESNIFDPKRKIITLDPLKKECLGLFAVQDAGPYPRVQPIEVTFTEVNLHGRRVTWHVARKDGHLLEYPLRENPKRLLPSTVDTVHQAKFRYRLKSMDPWQSLTVHQGMDLRFERDGDSAEIEVWLRERKFIVDVLGPRQDHKSV